jgi:probable rRNA maturation factor
MTATEQRVNVQIAVDDDDIPGSDDIVKWAAYALRLSGDEAEITVRVVGLEEGRLLNERWRGASGATNVLAFPVEGLDVEPGLLGDVVVCAPVANSEVVTDAMAADAHWAHLVIHGTLHLMGYTHERDVDAVKMEAAERTLLHELGYPDPYP